MFRSLAEWGKTSETKIAKLSIWAGRHCTSPVVLSDHSQKQDKTYFVHFCHFRFKTMIKNSLVRLITGLIFAKNLFL